MVLYNWFSVTYYLGGIGMTVKNLGLNLSLINRQKRKYEIGVGHNWETLAKQARKDFAEYAKNPIDRTVDKIGNYNV